jgi:hypothetical protein
MKIKSICPATEKSATQKCSRCPGGPGGPSHGLLTVKLAFWQQGWDFSRKAALLRPDGFAGQAEFAKREGPAMRASTKRGRASRGCSLASQPIGLALLPDAQYRQRFALQGRTLHLVSFDVWRASPAAAGRAVYLRPDEVGDRRTAEITRGSGTFDDFNPRKAPRLSHGPGEF